MLEHLPHWLGAALSGVRAGHDRLAVARLDLAPGIATIDLSSPAFAEGGRLPERFTADGAGVSPPLVWGEVPVETHSLALIVEDPDAPASMPLVHAILWSLPSEERALAEGAIRADGDGDGDGDADGRDVGRNSYLAEAWLPPDPPTGHGRHDYVFQLFALGEASMPNTTPGRSAFMEAVAGKVLGVGVLIGTYSRGEDALAGNAEEISGVVTT